MKSAILFVLIVFNTVSAQPGDCTLGARIAGMGGAGTALSDPYASFNNVGGAAISRETTLVFSVRNLFTMGGLFAFGAAWNQQFRDGKFLIGLYRFGNDLFSENRVGIGYSHRIRSISLGLKVNYVQQMIETAGTSAAMVIEAGGVVLLGKRVSLGACIVNPNRASYGRISPEPVPVVLRAGLAWQPDEATTFSIDLRKSFHEATDGTRIALGMEYILGDVVALRAGTVFKPVVFSTGAGLALRKFRIDYGGMLDPFLGMSHEISVIYRFLKGVGHVY